MPPLLRQLALRNFKSITACTLSLSPLTVFVGRNGAGKSNILDSLRFTCDALNQTLEFAMRQRGGIDQVRRRSRKSRPTNFTISMRLSLANGDAEYGFQIRAVEDRQFEVAEEWCKVSQGIGHEFEFRVESGEVKSWSVGGPSPAAATDRLFLVAASGTHRFRPVYDALSRMAFHNLNPDAMKQPQKPEPGGRLAYDGHNVASVVKELTHLHPAYLERAAQYLRAIGVPITKIEHRQLGAFETVGFTQSIEDRLKWEFDASSMSDGTLRAFGILVSVLSASNGGSGGPTLIGIEEPESALHPAATGALVDALIEGSERTQVLVTCHSPDILDHEGLDPDCVRVVLNEGGFTTVAALSAEKKSLVKNHLSTLGELQRLDQLTADPIDLARQDERQGTLFDA